MWIETVCFGVAVFLTAVLTLHPYTSPFAPMNGGPRAPITNDARRSGEPFRFLNQNPLPVTWPCNATLEVAVDMGVIHPSEQPIVLADLEFAFDVLAEHTPYSLTITDVIESTATQASLGEILDVYGADLLVKFALPGQNDLLSPQSLGTGGHQSDELVARYGWAAFSTAEYLDLKAGPGPYSRHALIVHEILHALNLAHVEDTSSVMYPLLSQGAGGLGPGDIAGLEELNRIACSR